MTPVSRNSVSRRTLLKGSAALAATASVVRTSDAFASALQEASGTLIFAQDAPITSLDPVNPQGYPAGYEATFTIYNNLVTFDRDLAIVPDLAESWAQSEDSLTWTFTLRQGVTFHDGTPFNAEAVAAHITRIQDPDTASPNASLWAHIASTNVVDETTIELVTAEPFGPMLNYLAHGSGGIESPTAVEEHGDAFPQNPVGTGPYKLESFTPGTELTLVANTDFYGNPPGLEQIIFRATPEVSSRVLLVETSEADLANAIPPEEVERFASSDDLQLLQRAGLRTFWIEMNLTREIFQDVNVRKAFNHAVNKQSIVDNLFLGHATLLDSPAASTIQGHVTAGEYAYDPELAAQMLTDAGWVESDGGVREKDGVRLSFTLNTANGEYPKDIQVVEAVQAELRAVGCEVEIWQVEAASRWDFLKLPQAETEYDMLIFGFNPSNGDIGYHLNAVFLSNEAPAAPPPVWNLMWYSNPEVDELLTQAQSTVVTEDRLAILGEAQQLIWDDAPMIWLYSNELLAGARSNVQDVYNWPTVFTIVRDGSKS
ncbi:glutathione ABC transporter substrate-binding protein [soil metagenome]